MATSRDVQEIVSKLSSDKAKARDEGVRLFNSWLEGERSISFCKLLGRNTASIKPDEIPHVETWPFLLTLLLKCIALEISASKKRQPKLILAKTLRTAIQCAEDPKLSGKALLLFSVVKVLFDHICDVVKDVPSFQSEYSNILRQLLAIKEYRYQMRKRSYCNLVVLYVNKVGMTIGANIQSSSKEEAFRFILTLHVLLENPPGDFPDGIREDLVKGFIKSFSCIRGEGKISRKLMECVNTYLQKDGPNLGFQAMEIHCAVQEFIFHCWLTTHDRGLKDSFILYARVQLKLSRSVTEESHLVEQLFDVIAKELDQSTVAGTGMLRSDTYRDDKVGTLGSTQQHLMELAAAVFYEACINRTKSSFHKKRLKLENVAVRVKDRLMKGLWLWSGAFCFLIRNYSVLLDKSLLVYWFEGACEALQRTLNNLSTVHSYDSLLWLLRSLQEFSSVLIFRPSKEKHAQELSFTSNEALLIRNGWNAIWGSLTYKLPMFSKFVSIVDSAFVLLGNVILRDQIDVAVVPQDIWDLQTFKYRPPQSALYFITCYFSKKGLQGDPRDLLHLRKNLLKAAVSLIEFKEPVGLNEQYCMLIPAAIFSLCAGCAPFLPSSVDSFIFLDAKQDLSKLLLMEGDDHKLVNEILDCRVEALAEIKIETTVEVQTEHHSSTHLPRSIRQPLICELNDYITGILNFEEEVEKIALSNLIFICSLLCNFIYSSISTRIREQKTLFFTEAFKYILRLLDRVVSMVEEKHEELQCRGLSGVSSILDTSGSAFSSFQSLNSCPLFSLGKDGSSIECELLGRVIQTLENLLVALGKLFVELLKCICDLETGINVRPIPVSSLTSPQKSNSLNESTVRIVDMELDADDGSKDTDVLAASESCHSVISFSPVQWRLEIVAAISTFFSVTPFVTWEVLFDLLSKENDSKVLKKIVFSLCKNFPGSAAKLSALISSLNGMMGTSTSLKLCCASIVTAICALLRNLSSLVSAKHNTPNQVASKENLNDLCDLINKVADVGLPDWSARVELIDCIFYFVQLEPCIAQTMIERLLGMLQDTDYRVRLFLARRIGLLFQTWDGHNELFQDICSNFGFEMVGASKEKLIKAKEVLTDDAQSTPVVETVIVTLVHIALCSEEVEIEAIFMICVVAAIDPCQRKLVYAVLDNLSRQLHYSSRTEYLEELMGSILFRWVACEVSLVALLEVQDLFVVNSETRHFVQSYCPWLLPPLILSGDIPNLNWISKVASQPLPALVKEYFVPIFSVCIALHCSVKPEKEMGQKALHSTILHVTQISERERDDLIKKHMVSIVGFLLSLSSSSIDPKMPFFPKDVVVLSIRTIVDGFVEMDDHSTNVFVIDKINVFRPDRVFKFLVEIHHQITAAVHPRHRCHHLSAIEVLSNIIGNRATLPSTSFYIFSIVGQLIESEPLQNQCCTILSTLLQAFKSSSTKEVVTVFGEQLQFLVSKLLACCITAENTGQATIDICPSRVLSLLHQLTVDADPSLYDYIRELEPFPELDCFERIRMFHESLCKAYSARDHFLKFVRRSCYLPQGLVMWSLRTLHRKLLMGEIIHQDTDAGLGLGENNFWNCDLEVVSAIWTLVDLCHSNVENDMSALLADFISRVGVGDPYRVVFHLPGVPSQKHLSWSSYHGSSKEVGFHSDSWVSEELLIDLLILLKKYLLDDSVKTVDIASRTLRGILSTERGHRALLSLQSYDRSMIEVHSKGVNVELVEKLLLDFEKTSSEVFSVEDSSLWMTDAKTYETWVCSLVHSLIGHSDDIILRLCQGIVSLKAEAAELLFGNVLLNLAGRIDMSLGLCQLISTKVQEHIFVESNNMVKSVQSFLNVLNRLRTFYVMEKSCSLSAPLKHCKPSSNVKTRSTSERTKHHTSNELFSSSMWKKVYWLSIDYLVIAKAAIRCGSYFTAVMYVEHWCEEHFNGLTLGCPDFSYLESLPPHIELLVAAVTQINEPDSIYGIIQSHKLTSQIMMYEHEGNWSKALEYHDLLVRSAKVEDISQLPGKSSTYNPHVTYEKEVTDQWKSYKGLIRSLQKTGCSHVLDVYFHGLMSQRGHFQHDTEFTELQYEAAWRAGNWDFSFLTSEINFPYIGQLGRGGHFNANLHSCLRALQEGDSSEFHIKLRDSKTELVRSLSDASKESTEYLNSTILKVQILDHLGMAWDLRWKSNPQQKESSILKLNQMSSEPVIPTKVQLEWLNADWSLILRQTQLNMNLLEPFIAFRRVLLQILDCKECMAEHLLQSASVLRKGSRFSLAAAALHELKLLSCQTEQEPTCRIYFLGRLEESKLLRAQGQHDLAISLANYILQNYQMEEEEANVHRLVGKWLAETRSSNSRTILEQYLKHSVELAKLNKSVDKKSISRQCQTFFHLAHYTDGLFKSYEDRLASSEWQAAMRLRRHKTRELDALIKRLKNSTKGEKTDYSIKIQELQKQLTMDREEAEKLQDDRDNFLMLALEGYQRCLVIGGKNDIRVVFRLVSLWFSLSSSETVITAMLGTVKGVQSYKFIPLVYQIASRLGNPKDGQGSTNFQIALVSLVKKMAIEHPYHTLFQLLALANGDRIKDKQRSRNSFIVDMDKKLAAENLLNELCSCHGAIIVQMKQMVELYIKLAELETKKEETNRKIAVPRDIRSVRQLELVPVVTASIQVDPACQYREGSFPYFMGLADSIMIMNGINAPKVVECFGSDGNTYRQLAKSGNDDLRQDAVMEQFFGLVNTFLQNHRDTRKRRLRIRTYKVVPFTPSAGVIEWVDRTIPLGEYLLGSTRNGGAHGCYGVGDWSFLQCREHMANEKDKRKAFLKVCDNFRPVMHYFFLERFLRPAEWFERRLSYTRSVAASSMVGYIVGLGDRHSMNILIDQATAEVVHIDLGVAFEQGLMLKTPERVPFRLTRDIIDGMGVTGVEGVFQRCCEETLSVMRTNKEALLTIIEVFIHDPLYKWALSPLKALQRQKETDDDTDSSLESSQDECEGNKDAARATLRVKQKLDGYEEGELRSVQGQVQQLIQDAIDTDRLCQLFPGWGAWL